MYRNIFDERRHPVYRVFNNWFSKNIGEKETLKEIPQVFEVGRTSLFHPVTGREFNGN
jgi:hypothetical protein